MSYPAPLAITTPQMPVGMPPDVVSHAGSTAMRIASWAPAEWPMTNTAPVRPPYFCISRCTHATASATSPACVRQSTSHCSR
jgi:hypothetical protein